MYRVPKLLELLADIEHFIEDVSTNTLVVHQLVDVGYKLTSCPFYIYLYDELWGTERGDGLLYLNTKLRPYTAITTYYNDIYNIVFERDVDRDGTLSSTTAQLLDRIVVSYVTSMDILLSTFEDDFDIYERWINWEDDEEEDDEDDDSEKEDDDEDEDDSEDEEDDEDEDDSEEESSSSADDTKEPTTTTTTTTPNTPSQRQLIADAMRQIFGTGVVCEPTVEGKPSCCSRGRLGRHPSTASSSSSSSSGFTTPVKRTT